MMPYLERFLFLLLALPFLGLLSSDSTSAFVDATDAFPSTNDQHTNIAVPRWFYWGQTAERIREHVSTNDARITRLRVEDASVPTFTVSMVKNEDEYRSGWWWYWGYTADRVRETLEGRRLISIDPYFTNDGLRFAVVMVPNTGAQRRGWWWYWGIDENGVRERLTRNNARLIDVRPYRDGGRLRYAVIMVENTDQDFKRWEWLVGATPDRIRERVDNGQRVTSLARNPNGEFDAVLVRDEGERWWWWWGQTPDEVLSRIREHESRLIDVSSYMQGGARRYVAVEMDDDNHPQEPINSRSVAVRDHAEQNGWSGGFHGSYFAAATSPRSPTVAHNSNFRYEPASSIKVLYLLYTLRQGMDLTSNITYHWPNATTPDSNVCPPDVNDESAANARSVNVEEALRGMMRESNNVYTRAFARRWGLPNVQQYARSIGLTNTHLEQGFIGCPFRGGVRNQFTLQDAGALYAGVDRGVLLSGASRTKFFEILQGGRPDANNPFEDVVNEEATRLGKTAAVPQFLARMNVRSKGGRYRLSLANDCSVHKRHRSVSGWVSVPFRSTDRTFVFGSFVNDLFLPCACSDTCAANTNADAEAMRNVAEAARSTINSALASW